MTRSLFKQHRRFNLSHWLKGHCLVCRGTSDIRGLCQACRQDLPHLASQSACPLCALPRPGESNSACPECLTKPPSFDSTHAAFLYQTPVDQWIHQLKYHGDIRLGRLMLHQSLPTFAGASRPQLLIPIPMPTFRQWRRGFNQADWIAQWLGKQLQLPVARALTYHQDSRLRQAQSNRATRLQNRQHSFALPERNQKLVSGKHIALIDDVMTTGSTLRSASKILKDCGACRVDLWIIARTAKSNGIQDKN